MIKEGASSLAKNGCQAQVGNYKFYSANEVIQGATQEVPFYHQTPVMLYYETHHT
jgi:hypothetical protein